MGINYKNKLSIRVELGHLICKIRATEKSILYLICCYTCITLAWFGSWFLCTKQVTWGSPSRAFDWLWKVCWPAGKASIKEQQPSRTQHFILSLQAHMLVLHLQYGPCGILLTTMIGQQNYLLTTGQQTWSVIHIIGLILLSFVFYWYIMIYINLIYKWYI